MPAPKDPAARALWLKRMSNSKRGKKPSLETRAKLSKAMRQRHAEGTANRVDNTGLRRGQTSQWKGDDLKYRGAHNRLDRERGRPNHCEHCDSTTARKFEWALRHDAEVHKADESGAFAGFPFSPRPSDYIRLCTACHHEYDERERGPNGQFV